MGGTLTLNPTLQVVPLSYFVGDLWEEVSKLKLLSTVFSKDRVVNDFLLSDI